MSPSEDDGGDGEWVADAEPDPPSLGPDPPSVDVPESDGVDPESFTPSGDTDPEIYRLFWRLVVAFDVAVLALSLGPMFVYFEGDWSLGATLFAFGAGVFAYGVREYRQYRADDGTGDDTDGAPAPDADGEGRPVGDGADAAADGGSPDARGTAGPGDPGRPVDRNG